ncbi:MULTISPECIES: SDR family NAD(P)-dependent oxidoreductase [Brachybacterium]|uniref:SDR family NAD(P)-dependent oxidoreductase n=1 Tax=Brachybacterium TaxID=43668 RepID=UPI000BB88D8E|nr:MULTISPECIES: SDR family oxidoreductase [Brachybacterium]PCC33076.1 short-chain dehydrogenase [Brachybacterium alimentarium]RCS61541.1 SDR family NAD(P)-dependent oxidoreductase [Brachybacterium sp. JB7]RCS67544.1 SDR family NAD(P)-dependent oxidoreductase [Brachybacterium alimentarium]RCS76641.1 SDR family NAD(P)-dependent oxidoreductase [Brachybacterium alimentarium]RCS76767.1 SDR family NAD(P)-dependent oxidoreductase [Brachybacterium alimentarium]
MSKTALVTGASRGIGLETTRRFILNHDDITTVVMFARDSEDFDTNVAELEKELPIGRKLVPYKVDVGDRAALKKAVKRAYDEVGNIDILVNNAGYTNPVPLQQVKMADFEKTMEVNVYAPFTIIKALLNRGNTFDLIVNIASTAGINGRSGWLTYSASKAAVINMSQVMREELSIYGTRVVCLSPGRTATALRKTLAPDEDPTTIMQPEHVAQVISTLSSSVGKFIDSENIVVRQ